MRVPLFLCVFTEENLLSMGFLQRAEFYFSIAKRGGLAFLYIFVFALDLSYIFQFCNELKPKHSQSVLLYDSAGYAAWQLWKRRNLVCLYFLGLLYVCFLYDFINHTNVPQPVLFH